MTIEAIKKLMRKAVYLEQLQPISDREILNVERKLKITLPADFKEICKDYSYEGFSRFDFFNFGLENEHSVIGETLGYRKSLNFPQKYLVLYEDDASFICMEMQGDPEKLTPIIWCAIEDVSQLCKGKPLQYEHTIFPSFTDFFEYLISNEEKLHHEE